MSEKQSKIKHLKLTNEPQSGHSKVSPTDLPGVTGFRTVPIQQPQRNLVEAGLAKRYQTNIHKMTPGLLRRHLAEYGAMLRSNDLPLSINDRAEIEAVLRMITERLEDITPLVSVTLSVTESPMSLRTSENWPDGATHASLLMHGHFCELVSSWNTNPHRRDASTVTVDEFAETIAISRFGFCSKDSIDDFIEFYGLYDFIVSILEPGTLQNPGTFWAVRLANSFTQSDFNKFHDVYKSAMDNLVVIHAERVNAIRNDGNKIYFPCVDHFALRETHELMRIRKAREELGAGYIEHNRVNK